MTWEELCEKSKEMGYVLEGYNKKALYQYEPIETGLYFHECGKITYGGKVIIENRTTDQLYQIMEALQ